jgi:hypothetical protein
MCPFTLLARMAPRTPSIATPPFTVLISSSRASAGTVIVKRTAARISDPPNQEPGRFGSFTSIATRSWLGSIVS